MLLPLSVSVQVGVQAYSWVSPGASQPQAPWVGLQELLERGQQLVEEQAEAEALVVEPAFP